MFDVLLYFTSVISSHSNLFNEDMCLVVWQLSFVKASVFILCTCRLAGKLNYSLYLNKWPCNRYYDEHNLPSRSRIFFVLTTLLALSVWWVLSSLSGCLRRLCVISGMLFSVQLIWMVCDQSQSAVSACVLLHLNWQTLISDVLLTWLLVLSWLENSCSF